VDVIAPASDAFLLEHAIAKGVMTLIDEHRAETLYAAFARPREIAGGSAANTMAGFASLGGKGLFVGKVKDDRLGRSFGESMKGTGVHFATAPPTSAPRPPCCLIAPPRDGEPSMSPYPGASREIAPADIDEAAIAASEI